MQDPGVEMARLLAVAYQTSETEEFVDALRDAVRREPNAEIVLLIPATPVTHLATWTEGESRAVAAEKAEKARARLEDAGVNVAEVQIGDSDPYEAIMNALADGSFDSIIVSTFPPGISRWLGADLISNLERAVDLPISHVIAR